MATVDLSIDQLVFAVQQLSATDRNRLRREIAKLENGSKRFGVGPSKGRAHVRAERRMSALLQEANARSLTEHESSELNALVEQFEQKTLIKAKALARSSGKKVSTTKKQVRGSGRR